jgi:hypothetical protein
LEKVLSGIQKHILNKASRVSDYLLYKSLISKMNSNSLKTNFEYQTLNEEILMLGKKILKDYKFNSGIQMSSSLTAPKKSGDFYKIDEHCNITLSWLIDNCQHKKLKKPFKLPFKFSKSK